MAKPKQLRGKVESAAKRNRPEIETEPDAWERFERSIHKIAPPKRRKPKDDKAPDK